MAINTLVNIAENTPALVAGIQLAKNLLDTLNTLSTLSEGNHLKQCRDYTTVDPANREMGCLGFLNIGLLELVWMEVTVTEEVTEARMLLCGSEELESYKEAVLGEHNDLDMECSPDGNECCEMLLVICEIATKGLEGVDSNAIKYLHAQNDTQSLHKRYITWAAKDMIAKLMVRIGGVELEGVDWSDVE
ncbi:hypothetical protein BDV93DRAFT_510225 [Ceratobasidium sp. AG-I]|nr:hypothetical protein BDV93DRAFT_510225 [Ceratobasidium sp. AG-I]